MARELKKSFSGSLQEMREHLKREAEKEETECDGKHESVEAIIKCSDCSKALDEM